MLLHSSNSFLQPDYLGFIGIDEDIIQISDEVESSGTSDRYRFDLVRNQRLTLEVDSDRPLLVSLLDRDGNIITAANSISSTQSTLSANLQPGTYSIRLVAPEGNSNYSFSLFAQTIRPVTGVNETLSLTAGATAIITSDILQSSSSQRLPRTVIYKVTEIPEFGRIELDDRRLSEDSYFTQSDIEQGKLTYVNNGRFIRLNGKNISLNGEVVSLDPSFRSIEGYAGNFSRPNYVWSSKELGVDGDYEILLYDETTQTIKQITDNQTNDIFPLVGGGNVVWSGFDGNDYEIFLFLSETNEVRQLTNNDVNDYAQDIDITSIIWNSAFPNGPSAAFYYDIQTDSTAELLMPNQTSHSKDNFAVQLNNEQVLWHGFDGNDYEVLLFDVESMASTQVTNDSFNNFAAASSEKLVAINTFDGNEREIFIYDSDTQTFHQITDNEFEDRAYDIDQNLIVGNRFDGEDVEVYAYDYLTGEELRVTDNTTEDRVVGVAGDKVIWNNYRLGSPSEPLSNPQVYMYDISSKTTTQVTSGFGYSSAVDLSEDRIFMNNYNIFSPSQSQGVKIAEIPQPGFQDSFEFVTADGLNGFGESERLNIQLI